MVKYLSDFFTEWGRMQEKYPGRLERITRCSMNNGYSMRVTLDNRMIIQVKEPTQKELYVKMTARLKYWMKFY